MKFLGVFLIITVILYASPPISAELSVEDLEKIRQIVNESEVRLEKRIEDQGKRITDLRERINFQGHLIIALIVAIITFVAVPMGVINTTETATDRKQKLGHSATNKKKSKHSAGE